jgi:hypothetical protein
MAFSPQHQASTEAASCTRAAQDLDISAPAGAHGPPDGPSAARGAAGHDGDLGLVTDGLLLLALRISPGV